MEAIAGRSLSQAIELRAASLAPGQRAERRRRERIRRQKSAKLIQALAKGMLTRRQLWKLKVSAMNARGAMMAMPGTQAGKPGWYQRGDHCFKFDVTNSGHYVQVRDSLREREWRRMLKWNKPTQRQASGIRNISKVPLIKII